jgi:hypothetical protein
MRTFTIALAVLLGMTLLPMHFAIAQHNENPPNVARKLVEYGYGSGGGLRGGNDCEVQAFLDNFAYHLKYLEEPGSRGYMIFYRGKRKGPEYYAYNPRWQYGHLTIVWKLEEERIVLVDGGYRDEAMMELWIVPEGAEAPKPSTTAFVKRRNKG